MVIKDIDKLFGPFNPLPNSKEHKVIEPIAFAIIVSVILIIIIEYEEES